MGVGTKEGNEDRRIGEFAKVVDQAVDDVLDLPAARLEIAAKEAAADDGACEQRHLAWTSIVAPSFQRFRALAASSAIVFA